MLIILTIAGMLVGCVLVIIGMAYSESDIQMSPVETRLWPICLYGGTCIFVISISYLAFRVVAALM